VSLEITCSASIVDCSHSCNQIFGGDEGDTLVGGIDDDLIVGRAGDDRLFGAEGNDVLEGDKGADYFDCGEGIDIVLDFEPANGDIIKNDCETS
jgi:Ca2+-binding RTX toxin-like protein